MSRRVAFVTHAGPAIGLGHVGRCLALAAACAADGADLGFLAGSDARAVARIERAAAGLRARGAPGVAVAALPWEQEPEAARDWLGRYGADVAVVDSYAASPAFLASLATVAGRVVAIDDLADRPLPVHVVVNGGVAAESLPYDRSAGALLLLGPRYALVDPSFGSLPARPRRTRVESVLLALGGGDHPETVGAALRAAEAALQGVEVHVVGGPFGPVPATGGAARNRIVAHRDPPDMRGLMLAADVAVTGAGVTLYELAASAVPAVIVQMADNQAPNAVGFARAGAALLAGAAGSPALVESIEGALARMAGSAALREAMSARAREMVDGAGATRVACALGSSVARVL